MSSNPQRQTLTSSQGDDEYIVDNGRGKKGMKAFLCEEGEETLRLRICLGLFE